MTRVVACLFVFAALGACTAEKRAVGVDQPASPPNGSSDPRIALIEGNVYQLSQGSRYFSWYGCAACHAQGAPGAGDLANVTPRYKGRFDHLYEAIANGHTPPFGNRIPAEQLWQITAYVQSLATLDPAKRRRQDFDQRGEPQGNVWTGPVQ